MQRRKLKGKVNMQNQKSQVNLTEGDKNIPSLYSARSNALELAHMGRLFGDVEISWFATNRKAPVAPYEELIEGYHSLSQFERQQAETAVDEYMTEPEAEQFAAYLRFMEKPRFGPMFLKQFMPPLVGRRFVDVNRIYFAGENIANRPDDHVAFFIDINRTLSLLDPANDHFPQPQQVSQVA